MLPFPTRCFRQLARLALGGLAFGLTACGSGGGGGSSAPPATQPPIAETVRVLAIDAPAENRIVSRGSPIPMTYRSDLPAEARVRVLLDKDGDPLTNDDQILLLEDLAGTEGAARSIEMPNPGVVTSSFHVVLEAEGIDPVLRAVSPGRVGFENVGFVNTLGTLAEAELAERLQYRTLTTARDTIVVAETHVLPAYLDADAEDPIELIPRQFSGGTYLASHDAHGAYQWHAWMSGGYILQGLCEQSDGALVMVALGSGDLEIRDTTGAVTLFEAPEGGVGTIPILVFEPSGALRRVHRVAMTSGTWHDSAFEVVSRGAAGGFLFAGAARTGLVAEPGTPQERRVLRADIAPTPYAFAFDRDGNLIASEAGTIGDTTRVSSVVADPRGGAVLGLVIESVAHYPAADGTTIEIGRAPDRYEVGYLRLDDLGRGTGTWARAMSGAVGAPRPAVGVGHDGAVTIVCWLSHDRALGFGPDLESLVLVPADATGRIVVRLDADDLEQWAHPILTTRHTGSPDGNSVVVVRADGSAIIAATQSAGARFDDDTAIPHRGGDTQALVFALDADGRRMWHRLDGGGADDAILGVRLLSDDSIVLGAQFTDGNSIWGRGEPRQRALGDGPRRLMVRLNANGSL